MNSLVSEFWHLLTIGTGDPMIGMLFGTEAIIATMYGVNELDKMLGIFT
jgi:hypothetical protein